MLMFWGVEAQSRASPTAATPLTGPSILHFTPVLKVTENTGSYPRTYASCAHI